MKYRDKHTLYAELPWGEMNQMYATCKENNDREFWQNLLLYGIKGKMLIGKKDFHPCSWIRLEEACFLWLVFFGGAGWRTHKKGILSWVGTPRNSTWDKDSFRVVLRSADGTRGTGKQSGQKVLSKNVLTARNLSVLAFEKTTERFPSYLLLFSPEVSHKS